MRAPARLRFAWLTLGVLAACGWGSERRSSEDGGEVQPQAPHPAPSHQPADAPGAPILPDSPPGTLSDTTGVLLPRDFDPSGPTIVDRYYLYLPRGLESRDDWPLILYLHGRSLRGHDLSRLTRYGLPARLMHDRDFPFVVIAPQLPDGQSWTDTDRLADLVDEVADRYPVDDDRVYAIGYSMGAGGVWRVAVDHPDLFAAAAPTAAWTPAPTPEIARALRDVPIRIDHGTADEAAPFARAKAMAEALEGAGVEVLFEIYPGATHGELTHIYKDDGFYAWLLRHERD